jgi:hypothetical protein
MCFRKVRVQISAGTQDYPDLRFTCVPPGKFWECLEIGHDRCLLSSFKFIERDHFPQTFTIKQQMQFMQRSIQPHTLVNCETQRLQTFRAPEKSLRNTRKYNSTQEKLAM